MPTFKLYGASDDLVEASGVPGADEFRTNDYSGYLISDAMTQLRVRCWYAGNGCWFVGVGQSAESVPLPPWPIRIRQGDWKDEANYSAVLEIDVPEGTRLEPVEPADL